MPKTTDILQKAIGLQQSGKLEGAERLYQKVLKLEPTNPDALNLSGVIASERGQYQKAIAFFDRAAAALPGFADVHFNKGNALSASGADDSALAAYARAISLDPHHDDAHLNSGRLLHKLGRVKEAIDVFREMARSAPNDPRGFYNLGICLTEIYPSTSPNARAKLAHEAETVFQRALSLNPKDAATPFAYANLLSQLGQHERAVEFVRTAVALRPDWSDGWNNLGSHLEAGGAREAAVAAFDKALSCDPTNAAAVVNRGVALLALGNFQEGWDGYARRFDDPRFPFVNRPWPWRKWAGEELAGKRILLWSDQGIGDEILYASMINEIARVSTCTVECAPRLVPLYRRSFDGVEIVPNEPGTHQQLLARQFDFHSSILDVGRGLRRDLRKFPNKRAYLRADTEITRALRDKYLTGLPENTRLIGLSWQSANPKFGFEKSLKLEQLAPLLQTTRNAAFVNVQYGDTAREQSDLKIRSGIALISDPRIDSLRDMDLFAAQLGALDCLVTVSNSTAHLAAALGIPTFLSVPDHRKRLWYWFDAGNYSPWYPSIRLFRESDDAIVRKLKDLLAHI